jgi:hypothetical protein
MTVRDHASSFRTATNEPDATNPAPTVVRFEPRKRPRGRPRRPTAVDRTDERDFDEVAAAVAALANGKTIWNAAKERVRNRADRDGTLRPASRAVLGFVLEHLNRQQGHDWHTNKTIAADRGLSERAIEIAWKELIRSGYIIRRRMMVTGTLGNRRCQTTISMLLTAGAELMREGEARARAKLGATRPFGASAGPEQKSQQGPELIIGQTLDKENLEKNLCADALSPNQKAGGQIVVDYAGAIPRLRPLPQFDTSLPMLDRLAIPGGRYGQPETAADVDLLKKLRRAARGWDLHELRDRFCAYASSANTRDAIEGFVRWMHRYRPTQAPNYLSTKD